MRQADFIVIGAGIAGASAAAELSGSHSVLLLEAEEQAGIHSTGRSAALFSETYGNRTIRALTRASRSALFQPAAEFASEPFTRPRGTVYIATREQLDRLDDFAAQPDVHSHTRRLDGPAARSLCPALRAEYVAGGVYEPGASDIDVHALHQAYLKRLRRSGGELMKSQRVQSIDRSTNGWRVHSQSEEFQAPVLINAAGAWADDIAAMAGVPRVDLQSLRRTALLIDAPAGVSVDAWPMVVDIGEGFYFKPDAGRLLLSPADETPSPPADAQPEEWDIAVAIERVTGAADIAVRRVSHRWAGLRNFVQDRCPVVGFDEAHPGFFWLAGQGGYGVQTAPAMGRLAAALARHHPVPADLAALGVDGASLAPGRCRRIA